MQETETSNYSEQELVQKIVAGETALFELIIRRFNPLVYRVGRAFNYHHGDTLRLMQDSFTEAYKALAGFNPKNDFKLWLLGLMLKRCTEEIEKSNFKNNIMQEPDNRTTPFSSDPDRTIAEDILHHDLVFVMEKALSHIDFDYRMVFTLREIDGLTVSETADLLHLTETNVRVRLNKAKVLLRGELEKSYSAKDLFEFNLIYCDAVVENVMKRIATL